MSVDVDECVVEARPLRLDEPREDPRDDDGEPEPKRDPGVDFLVAGGLDFSDPNEIDGLFETDTTENDFSL